MTRLEFLENGDWRAAPLPVDVLAAACQAELVESRLSSTGPEVRPLQNRVGAFAVGDHEIVVHPKAPFSSVLFMLGFARDPGFRAEEVGATGRDIFPALAETFARMLEHAFGRGVLQGYRRTEESAVTLRGRIRLSDQMSLRGTQLLPVEVAFDDYTVDIAENQILRAAARALLSMPHVPDTSRRRLAHGERKLVDVAHLRTSTNLPHWIPTRLNERYHSALRFAEMILAQKAPTTVLGGHRVASFVVNMADAFEGFLTVALTDSFEELSSGLSVGQYATHLDSERRRPIQPDFVHLVGGVPIVVIDSKYKLGSTRIEDMYQMLAYCTVLGLDQGTLIYAAEGADDVVDHLVTVRHSGVGIRTIRINVADEPYALLASVRGIAHRLFGRAEQGHTSRTTPR